MGPENTGSRTAQAGESLGRHASGYAGDLAGPRNWFHATGSDNYTATRKALAVLHGNVQRHAAMLSFVEAFWIMGAIFED